MTKLLEPPHAGLTIDDVTVTCRPRLLFQYLPYIQQDALQLDAQDVEAVLEATCGGGGAPGAHSDIWGVMLLPCCITVQAISTSRHMLGDITQKNPHAKTYLCVIGTLLSYLLTSTST